MSHPVITDDVSPAIAEALQELFMSGDSQAYAVADCLNDIASNGDEQATDEFLVTCAEEIISAADRVIQAVNPRVIGANTKTTIEVETGKLALVLRLAITVANHLDAVRDQGRHAAASPTMNLRLLVDDMQQQLANKKEGNDVG